MASVWMPLNYPEPVDLSHQTIFPDITINSLYELSSILVFDEDPVSSCAAQPTIDDIAASRGFATMNNVTNNTSKSLAKLKTYRRGCSASTISTSSTVSCPGIGCFSSSSSKNNKANSTAPYQTKRYLPPLDLHNNNSNASDGS